MRLVMVSPRCVPFMGGIETHIHEIAPRLVARGIEVTVLTTDLTGTLPRSEEIDGVLVRRFPAWPRKKDYFVSPPLLDALGHGGYDVCHVQGVHTMLAPLALERARRGGIPAVLTFHTGGNSSPLRRVVRPLQWRTLAPVLRRAARLIAVCEFERTLFSRALRCEPEEIALVRNGSEPLPLDTASSSEGDRLSETLVGEPLVLSIGRLERYKGHHRAIAAMGAVRAAAPRAHLVLVGSGPYETALRKKVHDQALDDAVSFTTFAPERRGALGTLVRRADVVALLSEYEAHPVAVMEALALGKDVVCADTSGLSELGASGLVQTVPLNASAEATAAVLLAAARERRWTKEPPRLSSWDECARALAMTYDEARV